MQAHRQARYAISLSFFGYIFRSICITDQLDDPASLTVLLEGLVPHYLCSFLEL